MGATGLPVDVDIDLQIDAGTEDFGELGDSEVCLRSLRLSCLSLITMYLHG